MSSRVRLAASARHLSGGQSRSSAGDGNDVPSYFETAQWTADGTTVLTASSHRTVSAYVVPEDLLAEHPEPLSLEPQTAISLPERTNVLASAPYYDLSEAYTNQILVSSRDLPIQLYYLFPPTTGSPSGSHQPASSYPLTKARSETFLSASSLVWPSPGSHFIAGCKNFLAKFDVSRTGSEPLLRIKTIPSERHLLKGGGVGMRGTVSTLAAQPPDASGGSLIAAGTWTRWIGLYDFAQAGECVATWGIEGAVKETSNTDKGRLERDIGGGGIMQTMWSPCGRYLLINERQSSGILVYDIRMTGQLLGWLRNREAQTNRRITFDVYPGTSSVGGFEVWSGTTAGQVKMWQGVGLQTGSHGPELSWQGHDSTVGSTSMHPTGSVVATCSGSWEFKETTDEEVALRRAGESTLNIWSLDMEEPPDDVSSYSTNKA